MLAAAQSRLDKANQSLALIKAQNDRITVFHEKIKSYKIVKRKANDHSILLRWILEQIPLIDVSYCTLNLSSDKQQSRTLHP
jgi:hypothetical protein